MVVVTKNGCAAIVVGGDTLINKNTAARNNTTTNTTTTIHKYVSSLWLILAGAASCSCLFSIFGPTRYMIEQQQQHSQQHQQQLLSSSVIDLANAHHHMLVNPSTNKKNTSNINPVAVVVPVADLKHEYLFHATIKSCLPETSNNNKRKNKCNEYVAPPSSPTDKPIQRIALVTPPGDLAHHILNQMKIIMIQHNNLINSQQQQQQQNATYDMDVFTTSHVPPYGYGKTHGLTKIIRLVSHPLVLQVTNALQAVMEPNELELLLLLLQEKENNNNMNNNLATAVNSVISILDLKIALRQIIRFHCRLSHVAAHTALLSLDMMNILQQSTNITNMELRNFLSPLDLPRILYKTNDDDVVEMEVPNDDDDLTTNDDSLGGDLWDEQERMGTKMLSLVQATMRQNDKMTTTADITSILDQVLLQEMQLTKNMTVWPCPSFWAAGDNDKNDNTNVLTPLTRRLAKALSPDCNNSINNVIKSSCWVERDKCEAVGDAVCQGNKKQNNKNNNPKKQQNT